MSILLFGDKQDFHHAVTKASEKYNTSVESAVSPAVAGDFFDAIKPELVVFCFDEVDKAEIGLKELYTHSEIAAFTEFSTLLLCAKTEAKSALDLCLNGVFNDYIIAKPLQDGSELEWRLQSLLTTYQAKTKTAVNNIRSELTEMQKNLVNSNTEATNFTSQTNTLKRQNLNKAFDSLRVELQQHLLPYICPQYSEDVYERTQKIFKREISGVIGGFSSTIDKIIESHIKILVEQYKTVDVNVDTAFKVIKNFFKPTVIVVDDNLGFREPITQALLNEGYRVITSDGGIKAVVTIIREGPDLVLMDYQLTAMNGVETIKQVKEILNGAKMPFFMMITGHSSENFVKRAREVGVDELLVKPLRKDDLLEKINNKLIDKRV